MPGYHKKPKGYVSDAQRKAVHASKKDGGKGNPNKPKMVAPVKTKKKVYAKMDKRRRSVPTLAQRQAKAIKEYNKLPDKEKVNKKEYIKMKMMEGRPINKPKMTNKKTTPPPTPGGHKTRRIKKEQSKRRVLAKDGRNYITLSPGGKSGAITLIGVAGKGPIEKPLPTKPPTSGKIINKPKAKFPDLSGDGKVTKKDILIGRGVIDKPKMLRKKRKNYA